MKKRWMLSIILTLCMGMIMLGCGKKEEVTEEQKKDLKEEKTENEDEAKDEREVYITIGNESKDAYDFYITNHTGKGITQVMIKTSDKTEYPANMMKTDEVWPADKIAEIFYIPETIVKESTDVKEENNSEKAINIVYNVKFVLEDGNEIELSSLGIEDIEKDVELCFEDEIGFVKYISKATKAEVSTKEQEIGAKAQKEAEAQAAAESQGVEAQTTSEESYDDVYYDDVYYDDTYYDNSYSDNSYIDIAPAQDSDNCLGGVAINP